MVSSPINAIPQHVQKPCLSKKQYLKSLLLSDCWHSKSHPSEKACVSSWVLLNSPLQDQNSWRSDFLLKLETLNRISPQQFKKLPYRSGLLGVIVRKMHWCLLPEATDSCAGEEKGRQVGGRQRGRGHPESWDLGFSHLLLLRLLIQATTTKFKAAVNAAVRH